MKFVIGITHEPKNIKEILSRYQGEHGSLTEVGPFVSQVDALNWLVYLKSIIGDFEEIIPKSQLHKEAIWYGFTFEKASGT